jgi:hypothetical protein
MIRTNLTRVAALALIGWAAAACDSGLTDVNNNPNAPTDVPVDFLLAQSIQTGVQQTFGAGQMLQHTSIWPQHFVQIQYPDEETGLVRPARMEGYWTTYYAGALNDIQTVINKGREQGMPNVEAVGIIWKTWLFHIVTDLWGDVPYAEALQGAENSTPVYTPQQQIYAGMLADLATAVGMFSANGGTFGTGDILYDNDWAAWTRFANSLRMRLAMRLEAVDATTAAAEFVSAYTAGGFTSNDHNAMLAYPGSPYENPLYENWLGRDDNGISATMVDTLQSLNDPRLALYAEPASHDGVYRGHQNGRDDLPEGQSLAWFSRISDFWRADGSATPTMVMTYAEVLFLEAEAAERNWIGASADQLYQDGIVANMELYDDWGHAPSSAEITAYLAQPEVQYSSATGLEQIALQKWIALWMNGSEAWAEWRRTGIPDLQMGPDVIISRIPVRFSYPDSELSLNEANVTAAIDRQGGGRNLTTPVWWDAD